MFPLRTLFTSLLIVAAAHAAAAAELSGILVDATDAQPIAGAEIRLIAADLELRTATTADGRFTLPLPEQPPSRASLHASTDGYQELGRIQVLGGQSWTAPIVADGKLIIRNKGALACLDLM